MIGASKILTVSYGTFSCTLEGFDDPFNTMKAIAEYFRDLAAEDRYFGAEPPQPDAAMLHRIAEREERRRVEARIDDHGVTLRAADMPAAAAPVAAAPAAAAPVATPLALAAMDAILPDAPTFADAPTLTAAPAGMPEGVAARLARIRAAVASAEEAAQTRDDDDAPAAAPAALTELFAAPVAEAEAAPDVETAPATVEVAEVVEAAEAAEEVMAAVAPDATEAEAEDMAPDHSEDDSVLAALLATSAMDSSAAAVPAFPEDEDMAEADDADDALFFDPVDQAVMAEITEDPAAEAVAHEAEAHVSVAVDEPQAMEPDLAAIMADQDASQDATDADLAEDVAETHDADARPTMLYDEQDEAEPTPMLYDEPYEDEVQPAEAPAMRDDAQAEDAVEPAEAPALHDEASEEAELATDADETAVTAAEAEEYTAEAENTAEVEAPEAETPAVAEAPEVAETAVAETPDTAETAEPALAAAVPAEDPAAGLADKAQRARARIIRIRRSAALVETPVVPPEASAAAEALATSDDATPAATTPEVAAELAPELTSEMAPEPVAEAPAEPAQDDRDISAALSAIMGGAAAAPAPANPTPAAAEATPTTAPVADEAVSRLMAQTHTEMAVPENRRRLSAIAHLKAAVAATVAERLRFGRPRTEEPDAKRSEAYRDDLARVVRPRRPEPAGPTDAGPGEERASPLVLVSSQRIDRPAPAAAAPAPAPAPAATGPVMPVRPRRISGAVAAALLDEDMGDDATVENIFSDSRSFAEFAEAVGAHALPDLIEAAAAYALAVEGRDQFTRPQLMRQVESASGELSREDGLRSFGALLRDGRIVKVTRGRFAVTASSRFLAEARRLAG